MRRIMNKLFTLVAACGLAVSTLGCAGSAPAPAPAPKEAPKMDETPAPAEPAAPAEEKK